MVQKAQKGSGDVNCEYFNADITPNEDSHPTQVEFSLGADTRQVG